jgi:hypothetical protein
VNLGFGARAERTTDRSRIRLALLSFPMGKG